MRRLFFPFAAAVTLLCLASCRDTGRELRLDDDISFVVNHTPFRGHSAEEAPTSVYLGCSAFSGGSEQPFYLHVDEAEGVTPQPPIEGRVHLRAQDTQTVDVTNFGLIAYRYPETETWAANSATYTPTFAYKTEITQASQWTSQLYWPGTDYRLAFFGFHPYDLGTTHGATFSSETHMGAPYIDYTVPGHATEPNTWALHRDVIVASLTDIEGDNGAVQPLSFQHIFSAIKVKVAANIPEGTISSVTITGIYNQARYTMGSGWGTRGTDISVSNRQALTYDPAKAVGGSAGVVDITGELGTLYLLPQELNADAKITVVYTPQGGTPQTLTAHLADKTSEWEAGKSYTYTISNTPTLITTEFTVTGLQETNQQISVGQDLALNLNVVSRETKRYVGQPDVVRQLEWRTEYSYYDPDNDSWSEWTTEQKSGYFTDLPTTHTGALNQQFKSHPGESINIDNQLMTATPVGTWDDPVDLSKSSPPYNTINNEPRTTANCYIVTRPGVYRIPLVYGNAFVNDANNSSAYQNTTGGTGVLATFVRPSGNGETYSTNIVGPAIYAPGSTTEEFYVLYEDNVGMIKTAANATGGKRIDQGTNGYLASSAHTIPGYFTFEVDAANIRQGGALISMRINNTYIIWSWHIWFTIPEVLEDQIEVVDSQNNTRTMLATPIGYAADGYYRKPRKVKVRFKQLETQQVRGGYEFVHPKGFSAMGVPTMYQWGRKDPYPADPTTDFTADPGLDARLHPAPYGRTFWEKWPIGPKPLAYPLAHLVHHVDWFPNPSGDWCSTHYPNLWNNAVNGHNFDGPNNEAMPIKTVYDPSPRGYVVPPGGLYLKNAANGGPMAFATYKLRFARLGYRAHDQGFKLMLEGNPHLWSADPNPSNGQNNLGTPYYSDLEKYRKLPFAVHPIKQQ